jgi:RNA recognition motif-containing protein
VSKKLFVGSLPWSINDEGLKQVFTPFGKVVSATVVSDRRSGRSKGFGFVEMENDSEAKAAIEALNGSELDGRNIVVNEAKPKE